MANQVNSSTFKKNQSQKKKNPWIPLVVIVVLALLMVLLNYFMLDVTNAVYQTPVSYTHLRKPTAVYWKHRKSYCHLLQGKKHLYRNFICI